MPDCQLEQLRERINQSMKTLPRQKPYTWKSVLGCAVIGPDMFWYRGQLLEVQGGHVKVRRHTCFVVLKTCLISLKVYLQPVRIKHHRQIYKCFILRDNSLFQTAKEVKPRELWLAVGGGFCIGFSGISKCGFRSQPTRHHSAYIGQ